MNKTDRSDCASKTMYQRNSVSKLGVHHVTFVSGFGVHVQTYRRFQGPYYF